MLLLKNMKLQRLASEESKTRNSTNNKQEIWKLPLRIDVETLSEEYMLPLKSRYPDIGIDVNINSIEDIELLPKNSLYYKQMEELINSPRRSIPTMKEELMQKKLLEEQIKNNGKPNMLSN
jgi:hypothetical protein